MAIFCNKLSASLTTTKEQGAISFSYLTEEEYRDLNIISQKERTFSLGLKVTFIL